MQDAGLSKQWRTDCSYGLIYIRGWPPMVRDAIRWAKGWFRVTCPKRMDEQVHLSVIQDYSDHTIAIKRIGRTILSPFACERSTWRDLHVLKQIVLV